MNDNKFFETEEWQRQSALLMSLPSKYVPTFRSVPSCVMLDGDNGVKQGSFFLGDVDSCFKHQDNRTRTVFVTNGSKRTSETADASDTAMMLASIGIMRTDDRNVIIKSVGSSDDFVTGILDAGARERDIQNLSKIGVSVYDANDIATTSIENRKYPWHGPVSVSDRFLSEYLDTHPNSRKSIFKHYVSALMTMTVSDLEFSYRLMHNGSAVRNVILQRRDNSMTSNLSGNKALYSKLIDACDRLLGTDSNERALGEDILFNDGEPQFNLLAESALAAMKLPVVNIIARSLDDDACSQGRTANNSTMLMTWSRRRIYAKKVRSIVMSDIEMKMMPRDTPYNVIRKIVEIADKETRTFND